MSVMPVETLHPLYGKVVDSTSVITGMHTLDLDGHDIFQVSGIETAIRFHKRVSEL